VSKTYAKLTRTAKAVCRTCGKEWSMRNALAVGAIHARSHGHRVEAVAKSKIVYDGRPR
jgi:hypothetical protein